MKRYEELSKLRKEIAPTMGLAASQARLLTITTRKSDCEFQSMRFSHQKIALSRDLTNISNEYQNALNATKLVYDFYGTGDETTSVNYNLLMTPSELNQYMAMLTTDSSGRVVLDNRWAAAAKAAGIPQEGLGCQPSQTVRNEFLKGMKDQGLITQTQYETYTKIPYQQNYGVGDSKYVTSEETATLTLGTMIENYIDGGKATSLTVNYKDMKDTLSTGSEHADYCDVRLSQQVQGDEYLTVNDQESISIKEILTGNYKLMARVWDDGDEERVANFQNLQIVKDVFTEINKIFGTGPEALAAISQAQTNIKQWLSAANPDSDCVYNADTYTHEEGHYKYDGVIECMQDNSDSGYEHWAFKMLDWGLSDKWKQKTYGNETNDLKGIMYLNNTKDLPNKRADGMCINLSNIAKMYITYIAQAMEVAQGGSDLKIAACTVDDDTKQKGSDVWLDLTNEKDLDRTYTITTQEGINKDQSLMSAAYDAIFTQICLRGWVKNNQVQDKEYLQEMYKSGQLFICKCGEDNYYNQENYATDTYIKEVTDDDVIAKAEAKYNTEKQRLNQKEEVIDLKMKNLDAEISSLTTEYDSVKNLISKNIEKAFKRYDA